jgi:hypothetical protein
MGRVSKFKKLKAVDPFNTKAHRRAEQLQKSSMPEGFDTAKDEKLSFKARQIIHAQNQMKSTHFLAPFQDSRFAWLLDDETRPYSTFSTHFIFFSKFLF